MKKTFIYIILILISGLCMFSACEDMVEVHEDYVENGEILYLTKVDSTEFFAGKNRGELQFVLENAVKVNRIVVYWNNKMDSLLTEVQPTSGMDTVRIALNDLPEGSHLLEIVTKNNLGNKSIGVTVFGVTYGDKYKSILKHRAVQILKVTPIKADIVWTNSAEKATAFELKYTSVEDEEVVQKYEPSVNSMTMTDVKLGTNISHRMYYLPEETALDTFKTDWQQIEIALPQGEFKLDRTQFNEVILPNDNLGRSWGGSITKLFDGDISGGNFYHTGEGGTSDGPPLTFTFDMGDSYVPTNLKLHARPGQNPRLPKDFEVWVTDDISNANTSLQCTDDGWEAESIAKGWTKIASVEGVGEAPENGIVEVQFEELIARNRYVRIKVTNLWNGSHLLNFSEISMWGKY